MKFLVGGKSTDFLDNNPFLNIFMNARGAVASVPADYALINADGYPTNGAAFTGFYTLQMYLPKWLKTTDVCSITWSGTLGLKIDTMSVAVVSDPNGFVTQSSGALVFSGTNDGTKTFTFTINSIATSQYPVYFKYPGQSGAFTFTNASGLIFCRSSDLATVRGWTAPEQVFASEWVATLTDLKPAIYRPMGVANVLAGNVARASYKTNWKTGFGVMSCGVRPETWAGALTNTGSDVYTCSAPSGWGGLVDGATVQGYASATNTTTFAPTLAVGGAAAKRIVQDSRLINNGSSKTASVSLSTISTSLNTLVYSSALDVWVLYTSGFVFSIPLELRVAVANLASCDYYHNFSHLYDDASYTAEAALIAAQLSSSKRGVFEFSNEMWNSSNGSHVLFGRAMSAYYGYYVGSLTYSWRAKREGEAMALTKTAWAGRSGCIALSPLQGAGPTNQETYQWQGQELGTRFQISNITAANPAVVETATPHNFSNGDSIRLGGGSFSSVNPICQMINVSAQDDRAATTTAQNFAVNGTGAVKQIWNQAAATAYILLGTNAAVVTADVRNVAIAPGARIQIIDDNNNFISIILASGTGTVTVIRGTDLNNQAFTVANKTATTFELSGKNTSTYAAYVAGGTVFKPPSAGNYPINSLDGSSFAPYITGAMYGNIVLSAQSANLAASSMVTDVLNWANGTPAQKETALDNMHTDLVSGNNLSRSSSSLADQNALTGNLYNYWLGRLGVYPGNKIMICYEGGTQIPPPTTAQLTAANGAVAPDGVTFPTNAQFGVMFKAYMNSFRAYNLQRKQATDFYSWNTTYPGVADTCALLQIAGSNPSADFSDGTNNQWAQVFGDWYAAQTAPYQTYLAVKHMNRGQRRFVVKT